jgi:hypothetical protein
MDNMLYDALGRLAASENRSISQQVIEIIKTYLGTPRQELISRDDAALSLAGAWKDERSEKEIVKEIRKSRATKRFQEVL